MATTVRTAGMAIENNAGAVGALGCFAWSVPGNVPLLLSCAHVLFGGARELTNVCIAGQSSSSACLCRPIGRTVNTWETGFDSVKNILRDINTGQDEPIEGYQTDCAIARLRPGTVYSNEFPANSGMGMVQGTPPAGQNGVTLWLPTAAPTAAQILTMYSPVRQSRVEGMAVLARFANIRPRRAEDDKPVPDELFAQRVTTNSEGSKTLTRQLLIVPRAPETFFAMPGDSGSVLLNHLDQVVGLLVGGAPISTVDELSGRPEYAYVTHVAIVTPIAPVLTRLEIAIPGGLSGTVPSAGRRIQVVVPGRGFRVHGDELEEPVGRLRGELGAVRLGRVLMGRYSRHRREMRHILTTVRHASATWHRAQGPAFVNHGARQLLDPSHALPTVINGVDRSTLIEQMAAVFRAYGSPALRRDVERYVPLVRKLSVELTSIHELPALVRALRPRPRSSAGA